MSSLVEPRRPRLVAQNRKLRHLRGLSLRNLSFAPVLLRTADDAALVRSPPAKLGVLREAGGAPLHVSRSSDNLRAETKARPKPQPRRTSLSWAHATPTSRQRKLEALVDGSVGDVFFSLHVGTDAEPVYVSEVRERSANFNFQFFNLASEDPSVARSCSLTIRVWLKRPKQTTWVFLLEELVDLRQLNFIGTLMDRQFPPNALIFHLEDGMYSLDFPTKAAEPKQAPAVATSSYNALMKLANLESSIQDAMDTQQRIMSDINTLLEQSPPSAADAAAEEVTLAERYVATQRRANRMAEKRRDELRESIRSRRAAIARGKEVQAVAEQDIANNREKLETSKELLRKTEQQLRGQRRRICTELADMFPITPIPNAPPLSFQICGLPLPNSTYDAATARLVNEDVLSAALGLAALLTRNLQFYLSHPLPYPLYPYGSRSVARDDVSLLPDGGAAPSRREFPLHLPRGGSTVGQWRFEYGWFLLNKDVEALCASQGLKVVDIRHSLPNLKYLLYVCSAGTDQVPERKKGGVRGLWAGRLRGRVPASPTTAVDAESSSSAAGSRRGSADSEAANPHGEALRHALKGSANGGVWGHGGSGGGLPFGEGEARFTLRTKGLRENIAG